MSFGSPVLLSAAAADDLGSKLFIAILGAAVGAALALLATWYIQAHVVPAAQARIRRLQRWEDDLDALDILLEQQLPRAVNTYRYAAAGWRRALTGDSDQELDDLSEADRRLAGDARRAEAHRAWGAVEELLDRLSLLVKRLRRIESDSPYWSTLVKNQEVLADLVLGFLSDANHTNGPQDLQRSHRAWQRAMEQRDRLVELLQPVLIDRRPPKD